MANALSLHIGVNRVDPQHYAGWSGPLQSCEADAEDMRAVAAGSGHTTRVLLTPDATRDGVIGAITNAATTLASGDLFFLTYSGHGGQVPDGDDADAEDDAQDETWCLFDGQLIDDELRELWALFKAGVRILVLSDSCHSGSVVRQQQYDELARTGVVRQPVSRAGGRDEPVFRIMPDDVARKTFRQNRMFYRGLINALPQTTTPIQASVRLISGCQDNQLSMDGVFNGLFTSTLLRVWNDGHFQGSYHDFHARIVKRMPPTQTPNHLVIGVSHPHFDQQAPFTK